MPYYLSQQIYTNKIPLKPSFLKTQQVGATQDLSSWLENSAFWIPLSRIYRRTLHTHLYKYNSNLAYLDSNQARKHFPRNRENVLMFQEITRDEYKVCYV